MDGLWMTPFRPVMRVISVINVLLMLQHGLFWANLDATHHPQSWRAQKVSLEDFPCFHVGRYMQTTFFFKFISSRCAKLSHCPKGENPTQIRHCMWKILAPKFGDYIWATHGITSQNKQCQLNKKILHVWNMRFLHVLFGPHGIVVGTTLHQ